MIIQINNRKRTLMKIKTILIILISISLLACSKKEPRKIKLASSDDQTEIQARVATIQVAVEAKKRISILFFDNQTGDANLDWLEHSAFFQIAIVYLGIIHVH